MGRKLAKRDAHIDRVVLDYELKREYSAGCIERDVASSEVPIGYNPRLVDEGKKIRWTAASTQYIYPGEMPFQLERFRPGRRRSSV